MKKIIRPLFLLTLLFFAQAVSLPKHPPISISAIPVPDLFDLRYGNYGEMNYYKFGAKRAVLYDGKPVKYLAFSPSESKLGFFYESSNHGNAEDVSLVILDIPSRTFRQVYTGGYHTSGWEWISDNEVLVSEGCGTECQAQFLINLEYGKQYTLQYGVDYQWSPDKKMVVAYNYSLRRGITVGDKFGKKLFRYVLTPRNDIHFANTPQALWSPDSSKLAVVMEKETGEGFELLVFDVKEKFKKIFQSGLNDSDKFQLAWSDDSKKVFVNGSALEK